MRTCALFLLAYLPAVCAEKAAYDSNGRITALLSDTAALPVTSTLVAVLPGGKRVTLAAGRDGAAVTREGRTPVWTLNFTLPDGSRGRADFKAEEDASGLRYTVTVNAEAAFELDAIEFVLDLPRTVFVNGRLSLRDAAAVPLPAVRTGGPDLFHGEVSSVEIAAAADGPALTLAFDPRAPVRLIDRWDAAGRSFQLRATIVRGALARGASATLAATLRLSSRAAAAAPARLTLDSARVRYLFDGFGGNYCWDNRSPISAYTLANLKLGWARTEMKATGWDRQRANPGPEIRADLEIMRRFQQLGVPFVLSIWWLPERFYTDPYEKPRAAHFRTIDPAKWEELVDLIGSYLLFAKREYSAEPDLFSFNESNIGIYVGLTPASHAEAIKRIGAHFRKLGLKTKMLLGDATGPRDTHKFVLDAAADPEALSYVGAVGFHSWGGGTPEQYAAWGDVAEWLKLPLLVTELGVDADAYHNYGYDSYQYGLQEARMTQELMLFARPQGTQFWQFTNDYALARVSASGAVEPTPRFWLVKHFTDLTPHHSEVLGSSSSEPAVLFAAFRKDGKYALHLLNTGPARAVELSGVADGAWQVTETTEAAQFQQKPAVTASAGTLRVQLPARSFVTLSGPGAK